MLILRIRTLFAVSGILARPEFEARADRRRRRGRSRLNDRVVWIVAVRAVIERALTLPVADPFAVYAEYPILMSARMATPAHEIGVVEIDRFAK